MSNEPLVSQHPGYYLGMPIRCDYCSQPLVAVAYDAAIPRMNRWANICQVCFDKHGCALGLGLGQQYMLKDGKWLKTGG